jgi:hypothetical protein
MTNIDAPARVAGRIAVRKRRCNRWNQKRREMFLAVLTETANVRQAAKKVGMSTAAAYLLKGRDAAFALAWRKALDVGYSELEMALLRQSLEGTERTEMVEEGETRTLKYVKTIRSFPFTVAVRLLSAHRDEVEAFRRSEAQEADTTGTTATERARAVLKDIRTRLLEQEITRDECGQDEVGQDETGQGLAGEDASEGEHG